MMGLPENSSGRTAASAHDVTGSGGDDTWEADERVPLIEAAGGD